jgi:formylmethanofuran dehydrogenase subunit E
LILKKLKGRIEMHDGRRTTNGPRLRREYFLRDDFLEEIEISLINPDKIESAFCHQCGSKLYFKNMLIVDDFLYCDNCIN